MGQKSAPSLHSGSEEPDSSIRMKVLIRNLTLDGDKRPTSDEAKREIFEERERPEENT